MPSANHLLMSGRGVIQDWRSPYGSKRLVNAIDDGIHPAMTLKVRTYSLIVLSFGARKNRPGVPTEVKEKISVPDA